MSNLGDFFLPHELITNILSRLPSEALLRFRCVCKSWNFLIKHDSGFHTLHLENANNPKTNNLAHWLCVHSHRGVRLHSYEVFDKTFSSGKHETFPFPFPESNYRALFEEVIGSCNGLLLVYHGRVTSTSSTKFTFSLWNPSTRTHKTLEELLIPRVPESDYYDTSFGVGFSNKDNDYKVVVFVRDRKNKQDRQLYLYSLRTNSWSELEVEPDASWRDCHTPVFMNGGTYFNGVFHWTCTIQGIGKILCFDFDDKSIRLMDLPPLPPKYEGYAHQKTFVHKGMLACWDIGFDDDSEYRIWVMKEYGSLNSWTSLFRVEKEKLLCSNQLWDLIGTTIDGKLFLYMSYKGQSHILMAYDPETKESNELQATNVFTLIKYQENLLMLL